MIKNLQKHARNSCINTENHGTSRRINTAKSQIVAWSNNCKKNFNWLEEYICVIQEEEERSTKVLK